MTRDFHPGMGQAVAERTILRPGETWGDVANRVADGNCSLVPSGAADLAGFKAHLHNATILMSGRHLQHGDLDQKNRPYEIYTNCSTSPTSFMLLYLLLSGSGVGRSYDDDMMLTNWDNMPTVRCVLDDSHPDFNYSAHESVRDARHKYGKGASVHWFEVPDSREGWAQAIEKMEVMAFQKAYRDDLLVLDFTAVRAEGSSIAGMQGRPSSGPVPLMNALHKIATLKGAGLAPWLQGMYVDHYLAEPVLVGGARRAARMAVKVWTDKSVLDFIKIKRSVEFEGLDLKQVLDYRRSSNGFLPFPFLWSSNNSVGVDADFWRRVKIGPEDRTYNSELTRHAREVFKLVSECSYGDGTGEPGLINLDQLTVKAAGQENLFEGNYVGSSRFQPGDDTKIYLSGLAKRAAKQKYAMITNPCGEIVLSTLGGFCVIADTVPYHAETLAEAEEAVCHATRALIRVNTMENLYPIEVARTNRIGVGQTGVHEFAWKFFRVGFRDLVAPDFAAYAELEASYDMFDTTQDVVEALRVHEAPGVRAAAFWESQGVLSRAVIGASKSYALELGVAVPHTCTTIKPAGCRPWDALTTTTSGIFTLQELFEDHEVGSEWGDIKGISAVQDGSSERITRSFDNGLAEVFEVKLAYGLTVESTANHPWFVLGKHANKKLTPINEWVATENLTPGMVLDVRPGVYQNKISATLKSLPTFALRMRGKSNPIIQPETMNPDLAWLLGYLWGDGAMSPAKYRLRWLDRNVENLDKANRILETQFGIRGNIFKDKTKDASSLEVGNAELWHWLIKNNIFKYHSDKIDLIPQVVRASSTEDIIAFLAGLIDADGAIARNTDKSVILASAQYDFARHVQRVGWAVGVAFGLSHNTCGKNWQPERKSIYLMTVSSASSPEAVAVLVQHSNKMAAADLEPLEWRCDRPGRAKRRILGKIETITSLGDMPTYDVEVENSHWFYDGSVKSHNTTSKLFGLTEGWHLPAMAHYLRWVQFRDSDPTVAGYEAAGYPVRRNLKTYEGTVIVGFPTEPTIAGLGMGEALVLAGNATPEEQYKWLQFGEFFWIEGGSVRDHQLGGGPRPGEERFGAQISYTLKYQPNETSFEEFSEMMLEYQPTIRCCSVMPEINADDSVYEYLPEQPMTKAEFEASLSNIRSTLAEDIGREHVGCDNGACPVDFKSTQ